MELRYNTRRGSKKVMERGNEGGMSVIKKNIHFKALHYSWSGE
jgi:hypothetical protein